MELFTAQLHPGRALGFLVLGASLHDILSRLKAEPQRFPNIDVLYSPDTPLAEPVCVALPHNGIRLRFDAPEQRLRLVEVVDFAKNHITFKEKDLVRPSADAPTPPAGPTFRHIYQRLLGPTYAGEFIPPAADQEDGTYVLSYPGVAFNFPMAEAEYSPTKDVVTLLSPSANQSATSMAVFSGESWADARETLWTEILPSINSSPALPRTKDVHADEVSLVRIHGGGRVQLFRKWTNESFWIQLGETTPQDLVLELGPPSAMYRKNDQKMIVHKMRTTSGTATRPNMGDLARKDEAIDTDHSSMNDVSDQSDDDDDEPSASSPSGECFYNYFYLGFDILLSTPVSPSQAPPGADMPLENGIKMHQPDRLVATKIVLHGNIPGSYEFNRHRRCRWEIAYLGDGTGATSANSEAVFKDVEDQLHTKWGPAEPNNPQARQRGMVLNRGWGDSPGNSCELLGGWEDSAARKAEASIDSTTTLYGFPGLVFEVLRNGYINTVTVF
ncbi:hypothetical protein VHEMI04989 [[Torrubiella] hemipterigena]|uniref:Uncharacterized protein n=1 Tax=[Torrubiella] hemipterigena TaxID=1531966 RepID=A0A0A1THN7_9HYPO|nr:hypothetical protein VHEMI04989 [[Torrubiella] hemipterigena]